MIEGLHVEFESTELEDHCAGRAAHHRHKAEWYSARVADLSQEIEGTGEDVTDDPRGSLRRSAKEHGNKAAFFQLLADHIIPLETYRLSQGDLRSLDYYSRFF